jgi:protocatechuate 4,5-dioxygenase alpha chain
MTFQQLASLQTGLTEDEYVEMMVAGGRPVDGNRSRAEQEPGTARNDG